MQRQFYILSIAFLSFSACSSEDSLEKDQSDDTTVRFTAIAGEEITKATTGLLSDNAKVIVHAWEKADLSTSFGAPVHTNNYTVDNTGGSGSLSPVGAAMKVQTDVKYFFYALSTNSDAVVPVLNGDYTTVALTNGIDYLMAVAKGTSNGGYTFTPDGDRIVPLSFRHLATRVELTIKPADTDGYTEASGLSVGIASIDGSNSYIDLSRAAICWPSADPSATEPLKGGIPLDRPDGQTKEAQQSATDSKVFTVSFILLPVASSQGIPVQFDFSGLKFESGALGENKSYVAQLKGQNGGSLVLAGGKTYQFTVSISRYSASFSAPKIVDWEVVETDIDNSVEDVII